MRACFLTASEVVNRYIILVILIGLFNVSFFSGAMAYLSVVALIFSFFIQIVVNGKITQTIEQKNEKAALPIIRDNVKNYLIALLVLSAPLLLFNYFIKFIPLTSELYIILKETVNASISVISLYVLPVVFLKQLGLMSVFTGVSFLFSHLRESVPIAIFIIAMSFLNAGGYLWATEQIQNNIDISSILALMLTLHCATTYLSFIIFAAATQLLSSNQHKIHIS